MDAEQLFCEHEEENHVLQMADAKYKIAWGTDGIMELLYQP